MSNGSKIKGWMNNDSIKTILILIPYLYFLTGCAKNSSPPSSPNLLQNKWTLISRTATFPGNPSLNFTEIDTPDDYLLFGKNDTAYSYIASYLPFSIDTASYTVTSNSILVHDSRLYGIVFQHQDSNGIMLDTTTIQILSLTNNALVLSFPTLGSVAGNGAPVYYPGTIIYSLKR